MSKPTITITDADWDAAIAQADRERGPDWTTEQWATRVAALMRDRASELARRIDG